MPACSRHGLPALDYLAAAHELGGAPVARPVATAPTYRVGDRQTFQTADGPREAELIYFDELAAYWVESGLAFDRAALVDAAGRLRDRYYPLLSATFGQEARPGIDDDPRFHVLHVLGPPDAVELGYFSDEDAYPRALFVDSNEREMVYLNMSQLAVGETLYDGTLVHEIQHLIQWNLDANEATWLNEGLSQVAETLAGLDTVAPDAYLGQPYVRLTAGRRRTGRLPTTPAATCALYLWGQAGDAALRVGRHRPTGWPVRAVLAGFARLDPGVQRRLGRGTLSRRVGKPAPPSPTPCLGPPSCLTAPGSCRSRRRPRSIRSPSTTSTLA
jgi:hypothetical protein